MALTILGDYTNGTTADGSEITTEFNNIYNNALSLISPLTGNLAAGGNRITGISAGTVGAPGLAATSDDDTGVFFSAADTVDIAAGGVRAAQFSTASSGVNYLDIVAAATTVAPIIRAEGTDGNIDITLTPKGTGGVTFPDGAVATPAITNAGDTNTGIYFSAADVVDITAGGDRSTSFNAAAGTGATFVDITPGATTVAPVIAGAGETNTGITLRSAGTGTTTLSTVGAGSVVVSTNSTTRATFNASGLTMGTNMPVIAAVATGTPAIGALFQENIVKGVARIDVTGSTPALETGTDYNAVSVSDDAVGRFTITWDRDFASGGNNLTLGTGAGTTVCFVFCDSLAAGTTQVSTWSNNTTRVDTETISIIALGAQ